MVEMPGCECPRHIPERRSVRWRCREVITTAEPRAVSGADVLRELRACTRGLRARGKERKYALLELSHSVISGP
jgi:hypothetical protein